MTDNRRPEGRALQRRGSCRQCGKCCDARSLGQSTLRIFGKEYNGACPFLDDTTKKCAIYGDSRPETCIDYPQFHNKNIPDCGYYFTLF